MMAMGHLHGRRSGIFVACDNLYSHAHEGDCYFFAKFASREGGLYVLPEYLQNLSLSLSGGVDVDYMKFYILSGCLGEAEEKSIRTVDEADNVERGQVYYRC